MIVVSLSWVPRELLPCIPDSLPAVDSEVAGSEMTTLGTIGRRVDFSSAADAVEGRTSLPFRFSGWGIWETDEID